MFGSTEQDYVVTNAQNLTMLDLGGQSTGPGTCFHVQIVIIAGQVIDAVIVGNDRRIETLLFKPMAQIIDAVGTPQTAFAASCCSTNVTQ